MGPVVDPEEARRRFSKVAEAMRAAGVWDIERPGDAAFENMGAFGMKTMAFAQWLRWVFVPRVEDALAENGPWPSGSAVSRQATREGDTDPAVASLVESLARFDELFEEPSEVAGRALALAERLLAQGRHDDALRENLRAIEICPSRTNVHNHAGYILSSKPDRTPADLEQAVEYFREAHSGAPAEVPPVANLADALVALGRTNEAIWELERISKQDTGPAADNWLGWHFSRQAVDLKRAERHLREAVKRSPFMGIARLNLAWVLDRKGDDDGAYSEYVKTLEASGDRDLAFAHARKGAIEERKGWLRNALASMRRAHELDAGERKAEYAETIERLETELTAREVWFPPKPSEVDEKRWSRDCFLEMPPELVLRTMAGSPLSPELIEVERLVRAKRFSDAAAAMERISKHGNELIDGIGIAERGANLAWEHGESAAAIALLRLAKLGYRDYASGATSGAEGLGRMHDVERVEELIRRWERTKKK